MRHLNKEEIENIIPHRDVMLLLDEAKNITENSGVGIHHVQNDEFWCSGHFPGNPVMPGVLQVEALAQTACLVVLADLQKKTGKHGAGYFTQIENCKFVKMVKPGDKLELEVIKTMSKLSLYKFKCTARINGEISCTANISAIMQIVDD